MNGKPCQNSKKEENIGSAGVWEGFMEKCREVGISFLGGRD